MSKIIFRLFLLTLCIHVSFCKKKNVKNSNNFQFDWMSCKNECEDMLCQENCIDEEKQNRVESCEATCSYMSCYNDCARERCEKESWFGCDQPCIDECNKKRMTINDWCFQRFQHDETLCMEAGCVFSPYYGCQTKFKLDLSPPQEDNKSVVPMKPEDPDWCHHSFGWDSFKCYEHAFECGWYPGEGCWIKRDDDEGIQDRCFIRFGHHDSAACLDTPGCVWTDQDGCRLTMWDNNPPDVCLSYADKYDCEQSSEGCEWTGALCHKSHPTPNPTLDWCNAYPDESTCNMYAYDCVWDLTNGCTLKDQDHAEEICHTFYDKHDCEEHPEGCEWTGALCHKKHDWCSEMGDESMCHMYAYDCVWDSAEGCRLKDQDHHDPNADDWCFREFSYDINACSMYPNDCKFTTHDGCRSISHDEDDWCFSQFKYDSALCITTPDCYYDGMRCTMKHYYDDHDFCVNLDPAACITHPLECDWTGSECRKIPEEDNCFHSCEMLHAFEPNLDCNNICYNNHDPHDDYLGDCHRNCEYLHNFDTTIDCGQMCNDDHHEVFDWEHCMDECRVGGKFAHIWQKKKRDKKCRKHCEKEEQRFHDENNNNQHNDFPPYDNPDCPSLEQCKEKCEEFTGKKGMNNGFFHKHPHHRLPKKTKMKYKDCVAFCEYMD